MNSMNDTPYNSWFDLPKSSAHPLPILALGWDLTTSFRAGTAEAPLHMHAVSHQVDVHHPWFGHAVVDRGIQSIPTPELVTTYQRMYAPAARAYMMAWHGSGPSSASDDLNTVGEAVHAAIANTVSANYTTCMGVVGGEHSITAGVVAGIAQHHTQFGILQVDAHMDCRDAYQGFQHSHASVMRRCAGLSAVDTVVQVGIRDYCLDEVAFANDQGFHTWFDWDLQTALFEGQSWQSLCQRMVDPLPERVYITVDVDGLEPSFVPDTGTPVPGGLQYSHVTYLIQQVVASGRQIIGFDCVEAAGAATSTGIINATQLLYFLCGAACHR